VAAPSIENIARVLLREWDPLGVAETDEVPEHEYLFDASELSGMLARGASVEEISHYLGSRGLGASNRSRDRAAAAALCHLVE
jgi:hypothetical protein